jgi:protocatechuate 3,4-dioxygenase beta subunit
MNDRDRDDQQTGLVLTRREVFALLGAATGAGIFGSKAQASSAASVPGCVGRPEQTEGPYFLDTRLNRSDIRSDPADGSMVDGIPLLLEFRVAQITDKGCAPLAGAVVDVWHCDSRGVYSGVQDPHFNTTGKQFLRGHQVTDNDGKARFTTIFPGWYPGRTVHIHFKIRINPSNQTGDEFTSQLYFDDSVTDQVYSQSPYSGRGRRMMRNRDDGIFRAGGDRLTLALTSHGQGYAAVFDIGLQRPA